MKYGAHCYLFTRRWSDADVRFLDLARELGLGMFELSVGDDVVFDPRLTARRAAGLGLDLIVGPGGYWPLDADLSSDDPAERNRGLDWHKRQVDLSAELGAWAYAGCLYGHPGVVKRRRPPDDELLRAAEGIHELADYAAPLGVAIILEPMSRFRTHLVNTPAQLMRLIGLADHPGLRATFDTYHAVTEVRDYAAGLRAIGPRLALVHACENDRGVPGGGLVPWETIFRTLAEIGFDGTIGLETYNTRLGDFAFERGIFQDLCPDGRAFIETGVAFLRALESRFCGTA
ncbi:MAG TPA: sugar phosphate isomerase/epimerase family protein [Acidobacteriota bacterium]|nr:sugar phosphate isomerase/epimerase family protein [Acidobacteriota bacterium]